MNEKQLMIHMSSIDAQNIIDGKVTTYRSNVLPQMWAGWVNVYVKKKGKYDTDGYHGKVIMRFWFERHKKINSQPLIDFSKITLEELQSNKSKKPLYLWEIEKLEVFEKPKSLEEFTKAINNKGIEKVGKWTHLQNIQKTKSK